MIRLLFLAICCLAVAIPAAASPNLIIDPATGKIRGGKAADGITVELRDGEGFISIDGGGRQYNLPVPFPKGTKFIRIKMRMRLTEVVRGKSDWQDARLAMRFYSGNKGVGPWPDVFRGAGSKEWFDCERLYPVPEEATFLALDPANFGASGKVEFANLRVEAAGDPSQPASSQEVSTPAGAALNLIIDPATGKIRGGKAANGITVELRDGEGFITIDGGGKQYNLPVPFPKGTKFIRIKMRMQLTEVIRGKSDWQDARLAMRFYNGTKGVGPWPDVFRGAGSKEWFDCDRLYPVPEEATFLALDPANFGASGKVEFANLRVEAVEDPSKLDRDAQLPKGVSAKEIDSLEHAWRVSSPSRELISLNGYWHFRPLKKEEAVSEEAPRAGSGWGYFKVPGVWPQGGGKNSSFQPILPEEDLQGAAGWHTAWYRRGLTVPADAAGKRVILDIEGIQTRGFVQIDGKEAGEIIFPGGTLDITSHIRPGQAQTMAIRLSAVPLAEEHFVAMDGNNITKVAASVKNKGITGDVFLRIVPETRVGDVHFITSVRNKEITFDCALENLAKGEYSLKAEVFDRDGKLVKSAQSKKFSANSVKEGRYRFSAKWENPALWDLHTPQNLHTGILTLQRGGETVDVTTPERFGFREFWIQGQNYMLNTSPIHLRAYHLSSYSAVWMPDKASKESSLEAFRRLREMGFNFSISRNYNFAEGNANYLRGHCEAADEFGHLHSISLPHPWQFKPPVSENSDAFAKMAGYLIRKYQNHPSVILWVTNHNSGGAWGDQSPLRVGGEYQRADSAGEVEIKEKSRNNFLAAQKRVAEIDPSRPVYSHASGSLGGHYSLNMYLNWAPKQERNDWLEEFYKNGKYPLSLVEWGLPHIASFASHRWPEFIWRANDVMTVWDTEYAAMEYGDEAARWTPERLPLLERLIKNGNNPTKWHPLSALAGKLPDVIRTQADYFDENLRSLRAWNIALLLPWDDYAFWKANPGTFSAKENPDRTRNLNRPGLVPDFYNWGDYILSVHRDAFGLSPLGEVIKRWNQPLIAWIGGEETFTTKEHIYHPGDTVKKQLVILNDSRVPVECAYTVRIKNSSAPAVSGKVTVEPGKRALAPVQIQLPHESGNRELEAEFRFKGDGIDESRTHSFQLTLIAKAEASKERAPVALYDPKGMTTQLLRKHNVPFRNVGVDADFSKYKTLVIGREALTADGKLPNLDGVRTGLNVLIFEQATEVMTRLGFRTNEYGLRRLFPRSPEHPALAGLTPELLTDWRGEATLLPPYLDYNQFFCPKWTWCGFENTRVWRCRNRGSLANVLPEKPSVGNFTPILDGGFALQYAPLLEYKEGSGRIVFCQAEVTGRSQADPAGDRLAANLLNYIRTATPVTSKSFTVISGQEFKAQLARFQLSNETTDQTKADVIVVGPGAARYPDLSAAAKSGKTVLAFGLSVAELQQIVPEIRAEERKNELSMMAEFGHPMLSGISNLDTYFQSRLDFTAANGKELAVLPMGKGVCVAVGVTPEMLDYNALFRLRSSYRRRAFTVAQLLRNSGIASQSPLLERFRSAPVEQPWLNSYYLQQPVSGDDPYRYYHW